MYCTLPASLLQVQCTFLQLAGLLEIKAIFAHYLIINIIKLSVTKEDDLSADLQTCQCFGSFHSIIDSLPAQIKA